jgi:hypothetical protein
MLVENFDMRRHLSYRDASLAKLGGGMMTPNLIGPEIDQFASRRSGISPHWQKPHASTLDPAKSPPALGQDSAGTFMAV